MKKILLLMICALLTVMGCQREEPTEPPEARENTATVENTMPKERPDEDLEERSSEEVLEKDEPEPEAVEEEMPPVLTEEDYRENGVNEMGEVMVIMYHNLAEKNSTYARTLADFKKDLETLYEKGYRPISLSDYVNGQINTPLGTTPFVLTFDDGHISNFRYVETAEGLVVDPDSVVGVLEDFHRRYEEFGLEATFFLNGYTPFGQEETVQKKIQYLVERGMDVGNHSYGHEHLPELTAEKIQETLGRNIQQIEAWVGKPDYQVRWLALPFGQRPSDPERDQFVIAGSYEGVEYVHEAVLKVGWKPEVSPFDERFDFQAIHRVQSGDGELQLTEWLAIIDENPKRRYISDGDPNTVVVPRGREERIDPEKVMGKEVIVYENIEE